MENLIEIWKVDIEKIVVDGYNRKVIEVTSNITGRKEFDEKILIFQLEDLTKDNDIIDDYGHWSGCKKATNEFFGEEFVLNNFKKLDYTGIMLKKICY